MLKIHTPEGEREFLIGAEETVHQLRLRLQADLDVSSVKILRGLKTLHDEAHLRNGGLKEGETLSAFPLQPANTSITRLLCQKEDDEDTKVPTRAQIIRYTSNLSEEEIKKRMRRSNPTTVEDHRRQLQDLMETLIGFPRGRDVDYDDEDPQDAEEPAPAAAEETNATIDIPVDEFLLQQMKEMGFPEGRARKALILNMMSPEMAMEWLFNHETDPNIDDPLTPQQLQAVAHRNRIMSSIRFGGNPVPVQPQHQPPVVPVSAPSTNNNAVQPSSDAPSVPPSVPSVPPPSEDNMVSSDGEEDEIDQSAVADQAALQNLREMGFSEADILSALSATGNNQEAAAAWLLGDRESSMGGDPETLAAILSNPIIQAALSNPRVLEMLRRIMENPSGAVVAEYMSDPEMAPIILLISSILNNRQ